MEKLMLVEEGIFPITKNGHGAPINNKPQTGFSFPGTVQGEGKLIGTPSLFIRLAGCNLRCIWTLPNGHFCQCDTSYASFSPSKTAQIPVTDAIKLVKANLGSIKHVVITGGEPLIQKEALGALCKGLKEELQVHITLETNGTCFDPEVARWVDLFSLSPKLSNSEPTSKKLGEDPKGIFRQHADTRINLESLQQYIDICRKSDLKDVQFKFVVAQEQDSIEIQKDFLDRLENWKTEDILLMPLGATQKELEITSRAALQMSVKNSWRYCPRVHIELFGAKQGV